MRVLRRGGYLSARQSLPAPWKPHLMYSTNGEYFWGYVPNKPRKGWASVLNSIWFEGHIKLERKKRRPKPNLLFTILYGMQLFGGVGIFPMIAFGVGYAILWLAR